MKGSRRVHLYPLFISLMLKMSPLWLKEHSNHNGKRALKITFKNIFNTPRAYNSSRLSYILIFSTHYFGIWILKFLWHFIHTIPKKRRKKKNSQDLRKSLLFLSFNAYNNFFLACLYVAFTSTYGYMESF